ncbi:MAG: DUF4476 domain-containing protein, partial [Chitinophagaceae bacterium]
GPAHIEILFQQNAFPPQKFTILMPQSGSRGFLLTHQADTWMLYDLQQGFYLPAGNTEAEDRMPSDNTIAQNTTPQKINTISIDNSPAAANIARENPYIKADVERQKAEEKAAEKPIETPAETPVDDDQPHFIKGLELPNHSKENTNGTITPESTPGAMSGHNSGIVNTDCPNPLSNEDFSKVFSEMSSQSSDEDRLDFMSKKLNYCYQSWQARTLVGRLEGDAARFELLKKIYPRITDQSAFPLLDDLLTAPIWKAEFDKLIHRR